MQNLAIYRIDCCSEEHETKRMLNC